MIKREEKAAAGETAFAARWHNAITQDMNQYCTSGKKSQQALAGKLREIGKA